MKFIKSNILISSLLFFSNSYAQMNRSYDIPFNPKRVQALGLGFDAIDMEDRYIKCIKESPISLDNTPNLGTKLSSSFVASNKDILKQLDIGVTSSMDMSFAELFSGSASFSAHYNEYFHLKEDEIAFSLVLSQDYGRDAIVSSELEPKYQTFLDNHEFDKFREYCGTHYYSMLSKKSYVMALVRVKGLSKETKNDLTLRYSSSLSIPSLNMSGKLGLDYIKMVKEIEHLTNISIEFYSIGGEGVSKLSSVIANSTNNNVSEIVKSISTYAESMSNENAAPAKFKAVSYMGFPNEALKLSFREKRNLNEVLRNVEENLGVISKLELDEGEVELSYSKFMIDYLMRQNELNEKMVKKCFVQGDCNIKKPVKFEAYTLDNSLDQKKIDISCQYSKYKNRDYLTSIKPVFNANLIFPQRVVAMELYEMRDGVLKMTNSTSTIGRYLGTQRTKEFYEASYWYTPLKINLSSLKMSRFDGTLKTNKLREKERRDFEEGKFWLKLKFKNGKEILNLLGSVNLMNCPVVK